jgi:hypothetical protein
VSGGWDGRVRVWDTVLGTEAIVLESNDCVTVDSVVVSARRVADLCRRRRRGGANLGWRTSRDVQRLEEIGQSFGGGVTKERPHDFGENLEDCDERAAARRRRPCGAFRRRAKSASMATRFY